MLVGPTGAGKSTLLKLLGGNLPVQSGTRELGHNVKVGYFSQCIAWTCSTAKHTECSKACAGHAEPRERANRTHRARLLPILRLADDVFKHVAVLSGGEKTRLALVKLLLDPPNLLLMDEPTTHLDIGSIDALIGALTQYEGTLIFISHDVHFIRAMAKSVLHISSRGKLTPYAGDYEYYLEKSKATSARAALTAGEKLHNDQPLNAGTPVASASGNLGMKESREKRRAEQEQRKAEAKIKREREQADPPRLRTNASRLTPEGHRKKELTARLEEPESYAPGGAAVQINRDLTAVSAEIDRTTAEWERLAATAQ